MFHRIGCPSDCVPTRKLYEMWYEADKKVAIQQWNSAGTLSRLDMLDKIYQKLGSDVYKWIDSVWDSLPEEIQSSIVDIYEGVWVDEIGVQE